MARSEYRDTHHTVSAGVLDALGRGFLIATAGVAAGLMFGTAPMASVGLWTVGVAAAAGVACMIGSALVRNAGCDRREVNGDGSPRTVNVGEGAAAVPGVEAVGEVASEERWARRMERINRRREHATDAGRGG